MRDSAFGQIPSAESVESADSAEETYLDAEDEETYLGAEAEETYLDAADEELSAELRAILSSPLFVGPDPSVLGDLQAADDAESAVDQVAEQERLERQAFADNAALETRVTKIYQSIIERAPEHKVQPSLERVREALDMMGNPQESYRAIHITGTNGKTSTSRMIEALLRERGLRTGRFTSPHLNSVRERIAIDGRAIAAEDFVQAWEDVAPFIEMVDAKSQAAGGPRMSFFEVFTVMAFQAFAMAPVDVAVVEVGMGGEWDATNVLNADISVLMPVALDHEKWLGASVEDIATEKLGIVKPGATLILAPQLQSVHDLAVERVHAVGADLVENFEVLSREVAVGGQLISVRTPAAIYEDVPLAMLGAYQSQNAAAALSAVEAFFGGGALPGETVEHALMSTSSPGRLEIVKGSPVIIVDAAHNPAGAAVTRQALEEYFPGPRVAVFSAMADKNVEGILTEIESVFAAIVVTDMGTERGMDLEDLEVLAKDVFGDDRVTAVDDLTSAIATAVDIAETIDPDAIAPASVTIMGSIMLAAQARQILGAPAVD